MTQHQHQQVADWRGREAVDADGDKLGRVEEVYLDDHTGTPEWLLVKTGLFGSKSTFVPLAGATEEGDLVRVRFSKAQVKDAPGVDADQALTQDEEATLYRHYGLEYAEDRSQSGLPEGEAGDAGAGAGRHAEGQDVSGPNTDDAMTRSEEELRVGTAGQESGRVRLRKHVETEQVQQTVPVTREEARVETEPITDANAGEALDGPAISEEEHEMVLHEEVPVVEKKTVPKERVRVTKDQVTDEQTVEDTVRKERVETDGPVR